MSEINPNLILNQLKAVSEAAQGKAPAGATEAQGEVPGFGEMLQKSIDNVNELQGQAKNLTEAFELGDPNVSLAEVMIAKEKSSVAFQAMLQVRNKLLEAYRDISSMQV